MDVTNVAVRTHSRIIAVLGPTNTGKTHDAIERMLGHQSGCIGFPLRLLARENYDRAAEKIGAEKCALVTGEEKIIPSGARYFFCTVESMPLEQEFDFIAVDEIQLCADPDRGHIFTDRLLHTRGRQTTMFMGAETIRPLLLSLIPHVDVVTRPRLSTLRYTGFKKLSRLPKRTAIVAFSVEDVYAIADLIRRQRGGTAIVLGALSPRTRNAQVEMYQSGEVDFMVATDAIGMGLNMDIAHVALASTRKFDGAKLRGLNMAELAQIAGRAGRYLKDGTFGVTGPVRSLGEDQVEAIEQHRFESLKEIYWRNTALDFHSPMALVKSLERFSDKPVLQKGRPADDYIALTRMLERDEVMVRAKGEAATQLLWDVCQIPDFRKTMSENHDDLVAEIFGYLHESGQLPEAWIERHITRLDNIDGDVDALMTRISHVRTWTYVTHRKDWFADPAHWQGRTLKIEDKLSEALHEALTKRFVDRRSAVLLRKMEEGSPLLAGIRKDGEVVVEGQRVGLLLGFRFYPDQTSGREEFKAIMTAARQALRPEIGNRFAMILKAEDKQFKIADDGQILWQQDATNPLPGAPVARIRKGDALLKPRAEILDSNLLEGQDKQAVAEKIQGWLERHVHFTLEPLFRLTGGDDFTAPARGIAFQLQEGLGILPRADLESLIADLDEEGRKALRARKVRMGPLLVFLPELNKPAAVKMRGLLLTLWQDKELPAQLPKDGIVSFSVADQAVDAAYYRSIGYPVYGPRAVRVDMLDRVVCEVYDSAKDGQFQAQHKMAEWLGSNILDLYAVLQAMGHTMTHDPAAEKAKAESSAMPSMASEGKAETTETAMPETAATEATVAEATVAEAAVTEPAAAKADAVEGSVNVEAPSEEAPNVEAPAQEQSAASEETATAETATAETAPTSEVAAEPVAPPVEQVKPQLATFRLKRGKATAAANRPPRGDKKPERQDFKKGKKTADGKKPPQRKGEKPKRPEGSRERIYSAPAAKVEDSPFAILQQLKQGNDK